jgi:putative peptide zinc metalloprotease protein
MQQPLSSIDRPLALRLRPDLLASPVEMAGAATWVVKDPLTLEHYHFSAEEYALVDRLRDRVSLADLQREFARQFPPQTITPPEIWAFLSRLHEAGLLTSDAEGQGRELLERKHRNRNRRWSMAWTQISSIRFRGINPDRALAAIHDRGRWLLSPLAALVAAAIVAFALTILIGHFDEFRARLPALSAFADWRNLFWLMAVIGCVKVLHELGHALACKHFGGEVPEVGLQFLVCVPCLYCDVTDAWRLPNKWHRILISAAGMMVEILLAAVATIVWWYAQPGLVQLIALDVMFVATAGTLLVNGNPLLRYDGYYILSDLVESPNLWQRSRDVLRSFAARWIMGQPAEIDALVPTRQRWWLAGYAVASKIYLALVLVAVLWGLVAFLRPLRLEVLAYAVGLTTIGGALVSPVSGTVRLLRNPSRRRELRTGRLATFAAIGLAALVAILAWPVNYYVHAPLVLLPADAARVYATVDGTLRTALPAGRSVAAGEAVAELDNADIRLELARLENEYELERLRLANLEKLRGHDPEANAKLPATRASLDDLASRLEELRHDAERLTLVAPTAGVVIPAPRSAPQETSAGRLPQWSGAILDEQNRGALVEPGTLVALVGDPRKLSAVLLVDDTDIARLAPGQPVKLALDELPGRVIAGEVRDVARRDTAGADSAASARADLASLFAGLVAPGGDEVRYQARVQIDLPEQPLVVGTRGEAKIAAERVTLARWLLRYLARTFRLPT